ncbi:hypothetical protein BKA65DRAFT_210420 [Rhexocercosporidium sp. MPI-PUGE-AT-0058]|nr:hypothetical protein BKA65DRAFT_210420 [Rhexocercosporidium sp. MPI-PUGE-AT-0058]
MDPPPITEDQEWTLRRWASTVQKRPRKRDKAFLQAEKGLSGKQIDNWWKNKGQSIESNDIGLSMPSTKAEDKVPSFQMQGMANVETRTIEHDFQSQTSLSNAMNFGDLGGDFSSFPPFISEGTHDWTSIGIAQEESSCSYSSLPDAYQQLAHCPPSMGLLNGFRRSAASSMTDTIPLLSPSSGHLSYAADSDRSSYASSSITWGTSSTLASICDHYVDKNDDEHELPTVPSITPTKLVTSRHVPDATFCATIAEEAPVDLLLKPTRGHRKTKSVSATLPGPASDFVGDEKYQCTACQWSFPRKGDWKRHEELHDPQTHWTCMHGEPAIHSTTGWTCAFCTRFATTRDEIVMHLIEQHNFQNCSRKKVEDRTFTRKDKLKQHLQQVHCLSENSTLWEAWNVPARKKFAWGCGYCGCCLYTWEGRFIHLAEHYEKQLRPLPRWSTSLVVKGLLRQHKRDDFKIFEIWKELMGASPNSERLVGWSESTAASLKRKLEFNEGSAREIATEAQRLALFQNPSLGHVAWTSGDSRVITLATPMVFEVGAEQWQQQSGALSPHLQGPDTTASMPGYF